MEGQQAGLDLEPMSDLRDDGVLEAVWILSKDKDDQRTLS
jgi:hypothetical protein